MKISRKTTGTAALLLGTAILAAACGGGKEEAGNSSNPPQNQTPETKVEEKKKEPITLTLYAPGVSVDEYNRRWKPSLEQKFPHITFKYTTSGAGNSIADLVARGEIPDLFRIDIPTIRTNYLDMGLAYDLRPLIQQYKYDMSRFNPVFTQEIVDVIGTGAIYGLPVPPYFPQVMYYNTDLFDKFGVPYPKDGMTIDEVYELAKTMTRTDGGTQYRGFSSNVMAFLRDNPYSHPILDPKVDGLHGQERWKDLFEILKKFYDIPNNTIESSTGNESNAFSKGNVAMQINQHSVYLIIPEEVKWDYATAPLLPGAPKMMGQRGPAYWAITNQSKHKEEAFEVIMQMLSDEVQMEDSKQGIPTTLNSKEIMDALGKEHPIYSKKNMKAITTFPPIPPTPKRDPKLVDVALSRQQNIMASQFIKAAQGQVDINTALREADELLKKEVEAEKAKQNK
jgi:multiple sugar transport system substrate-binding protein